MNINDGLLNMGLSLMNAIFSNDAALSLAVTNLNRIGNRSGLKCNRITMFKTFAIHLTLPATNLVQVNVRRE